MLAGTHSTRNNSLDLLRAVAIVTVVYSHGYMAFKPQFPLWIDCLGWGLIALNLGVPLFFVLSGYLIAKQIDSNIAPRKFWIRRFAKIYPTYTLLVLVYLFSGGITSEDALLHLLALQNMGITTPINISLAHLWSVAVEIQFYVIAPFLLVGSFWLWKKPYTVVAVWFGVCVLTMMCGAAWSLANDCTSSANNAFIVLAYVNFFTNGPAMLFGAWLYRIHEKGSAFQLRRLPLAAGLAIISMIVLCSAHAIATPMHEIQNAMNSIKGFFIILGMILFFPLNAFAFANGLLLFNLNRAAIGRGVARHIALASYQWYLLHFLWLPQGCLWFIFPTDGAVGLVVYFVLSFLTGYLSFVLIEEPLRKFSLKMLSRIFPDDSKDSGMTVISS